jgi:hypothetical protein
MKKSLIALSCLLLLCYYAQSQGCVAIRSTGGFCTRDQAAHSDNTPWILTVSNRYFKSFRHFVGTEEQKERMEHNTEVINYTYTLDLVLTRNLKNGWSLSVDLPVISNARSSLYEHGGNTGKNARHYTRSFGIGDIRVAAYKWLWNPAQMPKGNIQVGLGLKLPTGDYRYQDYFVKNDTTRLLGPVDQSIQLGDGGTGFTTEINAFYNFNEHIGVYGNFFYLFNPREQNGVSTGRGQAPNATAVQFGTDVMSVPDQFMIRAGISAMFNRFTFSAGLRDECLPSEDLIGGSRGFRRPGYIISVDPGVNYQFKKATLYAYVPVAIKRDRTQSVADKLRSDATGTHVQGDAAFADYLVNIGCSFKF